MFDIINFNLKSDAWMSVEKNYKYYEKELYKESSEEHICL